MDISIFEDFFVVTSTSATIQAVEVILVTVLLLPCIVLFIEVLGACFSGHTNTEKNIGPFEDKQIQGKQKRAILMPAHNEAEVIEAALSTVTSQMQSTDQLIVIADNCTDATAAIAEQAGAIVIKRHNKQQRGKGYALDFGLQYLSQNAPDVVVFIDADCRVQPGAIDAVSNLALNTNRPVQATYLLRQGPNPSPKEMISTFAFKVKNLVRPLGLYKLGNPCLLSGSGMAFPWSIIQTMDLANDHIVEDMKLGLDLAIAGHLPLICSQAVILGEQPQESSVALTQRTRWEHGHLQIIFTFIPVLLWEALKQRRLELMALALDISVPPLTLLVMLWGATAMLITLLTVFFSGAWLPLIIIYFAGFSLLTAIILSWYRFAREDIPINKLVYIPIYILWKIPLYFKFLTRPEKNWIRTERKQ